MALERNLPGKTLEEIMAEVAAGTDAGEIDMSVPLGDMQTLPVAGPTVDTDIAAEVTWVEIEAED